MGQLVGIDQMVFEVVDTSVVCAELDVPELETPHLAVGQSVIVRIAALGERALAGELEYVAPEIDLRTRTAKARLCFQNPDGALRANMFGEAALTIVPAIDAVLVPRVAIQRARNVELVFVRQAPDLFEARRVVRGRTDGDLVEVRGNVRPGDDVATDGSLLLKTETISDSLGAGCCAAEEGH
jgi:cobalt-zinc-cadmium efflux system membrane fusion protein